MFPIPFDGYSKLLSSALRYPIAFSLTICCALILLGCDRNDKTLPSVPLGEKVALEKLADAYREESSKLPVSPIGMTAQGRKSFIINVLNKAGFSYKHTLQALAEFDPKQANQLHRDLAQLLNLPHHALEAKVKDEIYSAEERAYIDKIAHF